VEVGGGGAPKSPSYFTFQKEKEIPFYCCFRPQGVAILWGQPLKSCSNFTFQENNIYFLIILFRP
jgi:hypothetical protein